MHQMGMDGVMLRGFSGALQRGSNNTWQRGLQVTGGDKNISFRVGYEKRTSDGWVGHAVTAEEDSGSYTSNASGSFRRLSDGDYIIGSRGAKKKDSENTFVDLNYAFDKNRSLGYTYLHASYQYSYHDPITYFRDAAGRPVFSGTVLLPNGNYISASPDDFLGYYGQREQDIHKLRYEDTKNGFKAGIGYSNTWKDGYSSANGATDIDWTGAGDRAEYPAKNYNADLQKKWTLGNDTLLAGFSWMKDKMHYRKFGLLHWKDWGSTYAAPYQQSGGSVMSSALFLQDELTLDARWKLQLGMRYDRFDKKDGYSYIGAARQGADSVTGEYGSEDSYFVTNLYLNYKLNENVKMQFGIENLFNRKYYAGEAANERTYTFGTTYSF